jgi:deoxyribodipyrimidine photo-lyase
MPHGSIEEIIRNPRVTVRRDGVADSAGRCVVYWMQRAQRAVDNPALDIAIEAGNALKKPVVAYLGIVPFYPNANLRHYTFLTQGIWDLAKRLKSVPASWSVMRIPCASRSAGD